MAILFADDFRGYSDASELPYGYGAHVSAAAATLVASSGRTVLNLLGGTIVKAVSPSVSDLSVYMIADMSAETGSASTHLLRLGINPPGIEAAGITDVTTGYLYVSISETAVNVSRRAYTAAGALSGTRSTIATGTPPAIAAGGVWRIEIRVNETAATCRVTIVMNGVAVVDQEYARAMGANPCASGLGYAGILCNNRGASYFKARVGDLALYNHDAATPFPLGQLVFDGLDTGVSDLTVTGSQTFPLTDLSALSGPVLATMGVARMEAVGITSQTVKLSLLDGADAEIAANSKLIVSGVTNTDLRADAGPRTLAQINAMKLKIEVL